MLRGMAVLLASQLAGESLVYLLGGAAPGPLVGLIILALAMMITRNNLLSLVGTWRSATESTAAGLLANLGVFFVPAGVGIVQHGKLLSTSGAPIAAALVLSTILTLVVTVWVFVLVDRLVNRGVRR